MSIRVIIADDQALVRAGLVMMVKAQPDMIVVGEAANGRDAVEMASQSHADIVLMDITMPGLNGIDATRQLASLPDPPRIIAVSSHLDRRYVAEALRAGASGYLVKEAPPAELVNAIRAVAMKKIYLSPEVSDGVLDDYRQNVGVGASPGFQSLSQREREVLQLIAEGKNTKEIASCLHVGKKTIDTHRANLMAKLDATSVAELVKWAIREGLASLDD